MGNSSSMHIPADPPDTDSIMGELSKDRLNLILHSVNRMTDDKGRYLHWDELRRKHPTPNHLSHEEWWLGIKFQRQWQGKLLPLKSKDGHSFLYNLPDPIPERLHQIDQGAGGRIQMPDEITNPEMKDRYYISSLIEESITSSVLEGAATTRRIAKDMIRAGRKPKNVGERMVLNNFFTMKKIESLRNRDLSPEMILQLHSTVTSRTMKFREQEGRFRTSDEKVVIDDMYGHIYHIPPKAHTLNDRIEEMCRFANGQSPDHFIHPVIRSIILHFWLAYEHPFLDGNGRTARALFYWSMLRHGYWLFEFVSISSVILEAPKKYARAFLHTESDNNDITYFLLYHVEIISKAIERLHQYIKKKTKELRLLEGHIQGITDLNYRQRSLLSHALRHPNQYYTTKSHLVSHNVAYETARTDLMNLADRGLLISRKIGRTWNYRAAPNLVDRLNTLQ